MLTLIYPSFIQENIPGSQFYHIAYKKFLPLYLKLITGPLFESFLLKSLLAEPKVLPYITRILISHKKKGYKLNHTLTKTVLDDFLSFHLNLDNHFEISWGLWLCKHLDVTISKNVAIQLSENDNSIIVLTALDVFNSGLVPDGLNTKEWHKLLTTENLYGKHWLLVYEASRKGWLTSSIDIFKDPFFRLLRDHDVEFYKEENLIDISNVKVTSNDTSLAILMDGIDNDEPNSTHTYSEDNSNLNEDPLDDLPF